MKTGKAIKIFGNIRSEGYTDEEKGEAIWEVLHMPTHMGISKEQMLGAIGYLFRLAFDLPGEE